MILGQIIVEITYKILISQIIIIFFMRCPLVIIRVRTEAWILEKVLKFPGNFPDLEKVWKMKTKSGKMISLEFFFKAFHFGQILFNLALYACSASWKKLSFCIFKGPCRPPSLEKEITVLEKVLNFGSKSLYEPWRIVQFTINNINFFIHDLTQIWGNNESMFLFFFYKLLLLYFFIAILYLIYRSYVNTSEISVEIFCKNMISSLVKKSPLLWFQSKLHPL